MIEDKMRLNIKDGMLGLPYSEKPLEVATAMLFAMVQALEASKGYDTNEMEPIIGILNDAWIDLKRLATARTARTGG